MKNMKKFLMIVLCSVICLQPCVYAMPEQVTTVIVNNNGKTTEHARADKRSARIFDAVHGTLLAVTLCGVSHLMHSTKLGLVVAGLQMYAVANQGQHKDSFICQYGKSIGIMTVAFTLGYTFKKAVIGMHYKK